MGVLDVEHATNSFVVPAITAGRAQTAANVHVPSATPGATWPTLQITPTQVQNAQIEGCVIDQLVNVRAWMVLADLHARE